MKKHTVSLVIPGIITFVISLFILGRFIGPDVTTKFAIKLPVGAPRCHNDSLVSGSCVCNGPDEINWQLHAYDVTGYVGSPFAVNTNAECRSEEDNQVAAVLDTILLYAVPLGISVLLVNRLAHKRKTDV